MAPVLSDDIAELGSIISENTRKVADYLQQNRLPFPSFSVEAPTKSMIGTEAPEIEDARFKVIDATRKLQILMLGPHDFLQNFAHIEILSMQAITRFNIASTFPIDKEASFAEISNACGLHESLLRRILRHAMTKNIFKEPRKGFVAHTAASRLLAEDADIHDWVGTMTNEFWQAASQTVNAVVKYPGSQEPNQTGFALANNTDKTMYETFSQHPDRAKRFGNAMASLAKGAGYEVNHLVSNFAWDSLGSGTVVDVGGSNGFVSIRLASAFPKLLFIVQDLPRVVDDSGAASSLPSSVVSNRVKFMPHDFFTEQPVKDADVYLFRWILHNFSDEYCIRILRNLVPALKDGALIVINDICLPEPGTMGLWQEERLRLMDLTMLELQNSCERELDEWAALFLRADARFKFLGGRQPAGSDMWILQARWEGGGGDV